MFEIIIVIVMGYIMWNVHTAFNNITKEVYEHKEKINNGWIDYRTKSAY